MPPQGRLGDKSFVPADAHGCPACAHPSVGPAVTGSPDVLVNNKPALRVDDSGIHAACCGPNTWTAAQGSSTVFINGKNAHRMNDQDRHCGGMGKLIEGSPNVIVGGAPTASAASSLGDEMKAFIAFVKSALSRMGESAPRAPEATVSPTPSSPATDPMVTDGIAKLDQDASNYPNGFPTDYHAQFARDLVEKEAQRNGGDYKKALSKLDKLQKAELGTDLQKQYTKVVGTDTANGWDKVRHFSKAAQITHNVGKGAADIAGWGKEFYDQAEHWLGKDPEGFSWDDIRADNQGEAYGLELLKKEREGN